MYKISWMLTIVLIVAIIVAIDIYFDQHYIAATARFAWNALAFAMQSLARSLEAMLALVLRKRFTRVLTGLFTAIGFVYVSHLLLTDTQVRRAHGWREKVRLSVRTVVTHLRNQWLRLPFLGKCLLVIGLIWAQVHFMPDIAAWFVLFPIAFLVPAVQWFLRTTFGWLFDTLLGAWYWQRFGAYHHTVARNLASVTGVRSLRSLWRLTRLRYLTAWRLWRYESCYRIARSSRRRISLFEPIRLWWHGELDRYVGRPLLRGETDWPPITYEPPALWYDDESPHTQLLRRLLGVGALISVTFTLSGSSRK